jgi:hypothetical protein
MRSKLHIFLFTQIIDGELTYNQMTYETSTHRTINITLLITLDAYITYAFERNLILK